MVTPISNNQLPSSSGPKADGSTTKGGIVNRADADTRATTAGSEASQPVDDTVDVDRASELFRSATNELPESTGNIKTAEEAAQLAGRISEQLAADGALAMQAQAGAHPNQTASLLSSAP